MNEVLEGAGVLAAAGASAAAILLPPGRLRATAMLAALVLFPLLILGDQWDSRQIADLRDDGVRLGSFAYLSVISVLLLAAVFDRWPFAMPLAIVAALPFRVPLESGGDTANLLVPLYLVIAGGVLATAVRDWGLSRNASPAGGAVGGPTPEEALATGRGGGSPAATGPAGHAAWLPRVLAAVVVLYALQTLYSPDFSKSLQNVCFFFVPFSLVYALLRGVRWDRELLVWAFGIVVIEAIVFVLIGSVEYVTRELLWNDLVMRSNEFHTYFRVNSVFWDPNIYGRYLALVAVLAMAVLLWTREQRTFALLTALIAVLWIGLVPTFSQSSFAALLGGLAVLAALKWSWHWTLAAVSLGAATGVLVVLLVGGSDKLSPDRINIDTSGRANLVSGGLRLFADRPVHGYGAGSFPKAYREQIKSRKVPVSVSHTEPITVAAEQGLVGFAAYLALIVVALWTMARGLAWNASPAGGAVGGPTPEEALATGRGGGSPAATGPAGHVARVAVIAAFVALLVHTMAYAGFYEDPITWVLLAVGASLAAPVVRNPT
jgi:putative inorganic carbon (hco3(-)) transporter